MRSQRVQVREDIGVYVAQTMNNNVLYMVNSILSPMQYFLSLFILLI